MWGSLPPKNLFCQVDNITYFISHSEDIFWVGLIVKDSVIICETIKWVWLGWSEYPTGVTRSQQLLLTYVNLKKNLLDYFLSVYWEQFLFLDGLNITTKCGNLNSPGFSTMQLRWVIFFSFTYHYHLFKCTFLKVVRILPANIAQNHIVVGKMT